MALGRRLFLAGVGAGLAEIALGGRFLPEVRLPFSGGGWRFYNVASHTPSPAGFRLRVGGLVDRPLDLDLAALLALPQVEQRSDFECVTGWKVRDVAWRGVRIDELLDRAGAHPSATHLTFRSRDGVYADSLSLSAARSPDTLVATGMDGDPLPRRHGGPARLVAPALYGYKSVKWLGQVDVVDEELVGYWERRGYARDARIHRGAPVRVYAGHARPVPGTRYRVDVPDGWAFTVLPGGGATVRAPGAADVEVSVTSLRLATRVTRDTTQQLLAGLTGAGLRHVRYGRLEAGSLAGDTMDADDGQGHAYLFAFFPDGHDVVQVQGQAPVDAIGHWRAWFEQLAGSLRR